MNVIAGYDPKDASTFDVPVPDYEALLEKPSNTVTIGVARGFFDVDVHPEVATAVASVADIFHWIGVRVVDVQMPTLVSEISELQPLIMKSEGAANHLTTMRSRQTDYTFEVSRGFMPGFDSSSRLYSSTQAQRPDAQVISPKRVFERRSVVNAGMPIRVPAISETTNRIGKDYLDMVYSFTRNTRVANYLGLPAASVRADSTAEVFQSHSNFWAVRSRKRQFFLQPTVISQSPSGIGKNPALPMWRCWLSTKAHKANE